MHALALPNRYSTPKDLPKQQHGPILHDLPGPRACFSPGSSTCTLLRRYISAPSNLPWCSGQVQPLLCPQQAASGMWAVTCSPALSVGAKTHSFYLPQFPSRRTWGTYTHSAPMAGAPLVPAPFVGVRAITHSHCWHNRRDFNRK